MRKITLLLVALAALALSATAVFAAVTFDPETGKGFVGKGDVQTALGLNNSQLQAQASSLQFTSSSTSTTDWTCSKPNPADPSKPDIVNLRSTTTTTQGILFKVDRVRNQINGFILNGYNGDPTVTTTGDPLGSCPANPSGFTYDDNAVTTPGTTQLYVNGVLLQ